MTRALHGIPRGTFIATNAPDWVYLSTRRPSIFTPPRLFPVTKERNQHFDADVRELGRVLVERHGMLVVSTAPSYLLYLAQSTDLLDQLPPMRVVARAGPIIVYEPLAVSGSRPR